MRSFPEETWASDIQSLDLDEDPIPLQRSLGVVWDVKNDTFTFRIGDLKRPYTRRGVLRLVNSLFDPQGLVSGVTFAGKLILRQLMEKKKSEENRDMPWDLIQFHLCQCRARLGNLTRSIVALA